MFKIFYRIITINIFKIVKSVSWPWLSSLRTCNSLTIAIIGKFACIAHHFIFEHSL